MPDLYLQRSDQKGLFDAYSVYVDRKMRGRLGYGKQLKLELSSGRHHLSVGGWWAKEAECYLELQEEPQAVVIKSEGRKRWGFAYRLELQPVALTDLPDEQERRSWRNKKQRRLMVGILLALVALLAFSLLFNKAWQA